MLDEIEFDGTKFKFVGFVEPNVHAYAAENRPYQFHIKEQRDKQRLERLSMRINENLTVQTEWQSFGCRQQRMAMLDFLPILNR